MTHIETKSLCITELTDEHISAVEAFNARLRAGGTMMQFPPQSVPEWLPPVEGRRLFQQPYVAIDHREQVRGGYILKHQDFKIGNRVVPIADLRIPIAESIVDRSYSNVATELLFDSLAKQPLLFGMGMGGYEEAVAKWFKAAGWRMFSIPFVFRIHHPVRFCRKIRFLRRSLAKRLALDLAAFSGIAWLATRSLQFVRDRRNAARSGVVVEAVDSFDDWADDLWDRCQGEYGMIAVRNREVLRLLYPHSDPRFHRLRVSDAGGVIGWCVLLDTQMTDHQHFGSLRLGSFVDGLASVTDAEVVVRAATEYLEQREVDLIISNQAHARWCDAFRSCGYLTGPSNYLFAASRKLDKLLKKSNIENDQCYLNRGDGDGPINL